MAKKPKQFKHILVAVDESEQGQNALLNGIHQTLEDEARLSIVSIYEEGDTKGFLSLDNDSVQKMQEHIEANLQKWGKMAEKMGVEKVDVIFATGNFGETMINDVIPEYKPDLVVLGAHSRFGIFSGVGSQANYVAKNAPISVLLIRK